MGHIDWENARQLLHATGVALEEPIEGTPERVASVYRERAEKLARPLARAGPEPRTVPVLVFRLDGERYGIEASDVSAVLGTMRCTPVPDSEATLDGLINVNGTVRPVLNLRSLLHLPPADRNTPELYLLLRYKQREFGVKVGEIESLDRISPQDLRVSLPKAGTRGAQGFTSDTLTMLRTAALFSEFWGEITES